MYLFQSYLKCVDTLTQKNTTHTLMTVYKNQIKSCHKYLVQKVNTFS